MDYAFPELHPGAELKIPSKNLLIFTQSSVDTSGRRHSVSIPLLPSSTTKPDTTMLSIQRRGSTRKKTMESIQEKCDKDTCDISETETAGVNEAMDCLRVPSKRKPRKLSRRQSSLPARKCSKMPESVRTDTGSDNETRASSPKRTGKEGEERDTLYAGLPIAVSRIRTTVGVKLL